MSSSVAIELLTVVHLNFILRYVTKLRVKTYVTIWIWKTKYAENKNSARKTIKNIYIFNIRRFVVSVSLSLFKNCAVFWRARKASQNTKRFIIQHAKLLCPWGRTSRIFIYGGMRDRSMWSGTKLAWEIQLTDWSMTGNLSNRSSGIQIPHDICTRFGRYY